MANTGTRPIVSRQAVRVACQPRVADSVWYAARSVGSTGTRIGSRVTLQTPCPSPTPTGDWRPEMEAAEQGIPSPPGAAKVALGGGELNPPDEVARGPPGGRGRCEDGVLGS